MLAALKAAPSASFSFILLRQAAVPVTFLYVMGQLMGDSPLAVNLYPVEIVNISDDLVLFIIMHAQYVYIN